MKAAVDFFGFHNNAERICKKLLERFAMLVELRRNEPTRCKHNDAGNKVERY